MIHTTKNVNKQELLKQNQESPTTCPTGPDTSRFCTPAHRACPSAAPCRSARHRPMGPCQTPSAVAPLVQVVGVGMASVAVVAARPPSCWWAYFSAAAVAVAWSPPPQHHPHHPHHLLPPPPPNTSRPNVGIPTMQSDPPPPLLPRPSQ